MDNKSFKFTRHEKILLISPVIIILIQSIINHYNASESIIINIINSLKSSFLFSLLILLFSWIMILITEVIILIPNLGKQKMEVYRNSENYDEWRLEKRLIPVYLIFTIIVIIVIQLGGIDINNL